MFKAIFSLFKSIIVLAKAFCSIVFILLSVVCSLTKALSNVCSALFIRHKGNQEIKRLKNELENEEREQCLHKKPNQE